MLDFLHERVIDFKGRILGFEEYNEFVIMAVEPGSPYVYLQSVTDEHIGFLTVSPFTFRPDYVFEIEDGDREQLELQSPEDVAVVNIVTIRDPFQLSTVNLLAPVVINVRTGQGKQVVLSPKSSFTTKDPLFPKATEKKEELQSADSDA